MKHVYLISHLLPNGVSVICGISDTNMFANVQQVVKAKLDDKYTAHRLFHGPNGRLEIGIDDDGQWEEVEGRIVVDEYPLIGFSL